MELKSGKNNPSTHLTMSIITNNTQTLSKVLTPTFCTEENSDLLCKAFKTSIMVSYIECITTLIPHVAKHINCRDRFGKTPLYQAAEAGNEALVNLLLQHGARNNFNNNEDDIPLHIACKKNYQSIVCLLIKNGAFIDTQNKAGHTPLFVAASCGHADIITILLKAGASTTIPCHPIFGEVETIPALFPLQIAQRNNNLICAQKIQEHIDIARRQKKKEFNRYLQALGFSTKISQEKLHFQSAGS